jgi:hypothetical protein
MRDNDGLETKTHSNGALPVVWQAGGHSQQKALNRTVRSQDNQVARNGSLSRHALKTSSRDMTRSLVVTACKRSVP